MIFSLPQFSWALSQLHNLPLQQSACSRFCHFPRIYLSNREDICFRILGYHHSIFIIQYDFLEFRIRFPLLILFCFRFVFLFVNFINFFHFKSFLIFFKFFVIFKLVFSLKIHFTL